jgi:transporter family-2 protein
MEFFVLFLAGLIAGGLIAIQSVLNATMGERIGALGSMLLITLISIATLLGLVALFPGMANFRRLPGLSEWYLYVGGVMGIAILSTPILLIPRIGTAATLTALVVGQLALAVLVDHFGWLGTPRVEVSWVRLLGVALLFVGAFLVVRR